MLSNLHDIFVIINEYRGSGYLIFVYAAAFVYLLFAEKRRLNRILALYIPLTLMILLLCPVFYHIYVVYLDDSGTYYRMLWMLSMTVTIAYAACNLIYRFRRLGLILITVIIIACGGYAYVDGEHASLAKAQNPYHIPQYVIELCDMMPQHIEGVNVFACVPLEMLFYVRQYDSDICLIYGRDAVEPSWGYYNEFYEAYELGVAIDLAKMLELTRNNGARVCTYFVVKEDRKFVGDPAKMGLEKIAQVDEYILYRDNVAVEIVKEMFKGTAYDK